jgi:hypothetical protein
MLDRPKMTAQEKVMDCCDSNSTFSYSSVNASAEEHDKQCTHPIEAMPEVKCAETHSTPITPLQSILDQKDLDAAAACLAFAGMLERTGCSEQAEFFYDKMRSIVAQYVSLLPSDQNIQE